MEIESRDNPCVLLIWMCYDLISTFGSALGITLCLKKARVRKPRREEKRINIQKLPQVIKNSKPIRRPENDRFTHTAKTKPIAYKVTFLI